MSRRRLTDLKKGAGSFEIIDGDDDKNALAADMHRGDYLKRLGQTYGNQNVPSFGQGREM